MRVFYDILPVFLFFVAFKIYDIYVATIVGIIATLLQVIVHRVLTKGWDKKQIITLVIFLFFGSMTLYFHNPIFVKWKPTIVFWVFACTILIGQFIAKKPLIQSMMESMLKEQQHVPQFVWRRLTMMWMIFFIGLGIINLYVAYHFSDNAWVNFKFYGITAALFLFSLFQTIYLLRYTQKSN